VISIPPLDRSTAETTFDNLKALQRLFKGGAEALKKYPALQRKLDEYLGSGDDSAGAFHMANSNVALWKIKAIMAATGLGPIGIAVMTLATIVTLGITIAEYLNPEGRTMIKIAFVQIAVQLQAVTLRVQTFVGT
jgi:hypothetical protein